MLPNSKLKDGKFTTERNALIWHALDEFIQVQTIFFCCNVCNCFGMPS